MTNAKLLSDLENLVETSTVDDLRLKPAIQVKKDHWFSPDVMQQRSGRPQVGVQGIILDAMDDDRITVDQAMALLKRVQERLRMANGPHA